MPLCALLVLITVVLTSCNHAIEKIILSTNDCEIVVGETYHLTYSIFPDTAENSGLKWESADETVAVVDEHGIISAISSGQTTITISSSNGIIESCSVTVLQKTAYDSLSDEEKTFVDCLLKYASSFKNPASISIRAIMDMSLGVDGSAYFVDISAQNGFGGNTVSTFLLCDDAKVEGFPEYSNGIFDIGSLPLTNDDDFDLQLINDAIQEELS